MKHVCFIGVWLLSAMYAQAQTPQKVKFGLQAGVLVNDQHDKAIQVYVPPGTTPSVQYTNRTIRRPALGYRLGLTLQRVLTDRFAVGATLSWYQSGSVSEQQYSSTSSTNQSSLTHDRYRFQYVQVPAWFQYSLTNVPGRPYLRVGPTYTYLINSHVTTTYTYTLNATENSRVEDNDLPIKGEYAGFPRHDWQVMTEVGVCLSKRFKLGLRYDLLARQRTAFQISPYDNDRYHSFRNRNVGLITEILF